MNPSHSRTVTELVADVSTKIAAVDAGQREGGREGRREGCARGWRKFPKSRS